MSNIANESYCTGLEVLLTAKDRTKEWGNVALLCNQASTTRNFKEGASELATLFGKRLKCLLSPQHGYYSTEQDNMIETEHSKHPSLDIPIFSLYSKTREPDARAMENFDTLIIDIQIVGCRIYTFKASMLACLRICKQWGKKIVILDRPNPVGCNTIEGRSPDPSELSFVGPYVMPMRHGLTAAEVLLLFNLEINADIEVCKLQGYVAKDVLRGQLWAQTSPNLPSLDTIYAYPGTVIFEGSNVSEGRGTCLPFLLIGAPYIASSKVLKEDILHLNKDNRGFVLREISFRPTFGKWQGEECKGVQIHVTEPESLLSMRLGLSMLASFMRLGGKNFTYKQPPYEYEFEKLPMQIILGSKNFHKHLEFYDADDSFWEEGISAYKNKISDILLYPRS